MHLNLDRARATWGQVSKILTCREVLVPVTGMFYQAAVAALLLYTSESWLLPPSTLKVLKDFYV